MTNLLHVTTTLPSQDAVLRLARVLVETRLAACVQVAGPVRSVYRWQGALEEAEEWYCHAKTTRARWAELEARIRAEHPYQVPEIVAVEIVEGSEGYLAWVDQETA